MITKLEISGFKSFQNFEVSLSPFVVVAGVNGSGKSNLFDAIQLLSRLADMDLRSAFSGLRGDAFELFSQNSDGSSATEMHFAVEMLLDRKVRDTWGSEAELKYTRLRYAVSIQRKPDKRGVERLFVSKEELTVIRRGDDEWYKHYVGAHNHYWHVQVTGGRAPFISTMPDETTGIATINLHQDKGSRGRPRPAADLEGTMLSGANNTEFPHALAVREEMKNWRFLQLNPVELSKPAPKFTAKEFMGVDGSDLAASMFRIKTDDPLNIKKISRDMANLIPGIVSIDVEEDQTEKRYVIKAKMEDGRFFSSRVMSEGTLRLLALCSLKHDERHRGVLCFEEPENGINPTRIPQVIQLLRELATNFAREEKAPFPARQVLVNSHSPGLVAEVCKLPGFSAFGSILFSRMVTHIQQGKKSQYTRLQEVDLSLSTMPNPEFNFDPIVRDVQRRIGQQELVNYLETRDFDSVLTTLNEP